MEKKKEKKDIFKVLVLIKRNINNYLNYYKTFWVVSSTLQEAITQLHNNLTEDYSILKVEKISGEDDEVIF